MLNTEELDRWAALDGADFAFGLLLTRVERERGSEEAAALLREAHSFVFRETGISLREEEPELPTVDEVGAELAGRGFIRSLGRSERGKATALAMLGGARTPRRQGLTRSAHDTSRRLPVRGASFFFCSPAVALREPAVASGEDWRSERNSHAASISTQPPLADTDARVSRSPRESFMIRS